MDIPTTPANRESRSRGFTLVELLIVVVILALLAAVAIPTFGDTTAGARESATAGNLATIRQAIALYRVQHDDVYPGQTDWNEFVAQLTTATHADGSPGGTLGPYLRTGIPNSPITGQNSGKNVTTMAGGPSGTEAWAYLPSNGEIRANIAGTAPSGTDYWDL